jgi:hypothetical protein
MSVKMTGHLDGTFGRRNGRGTNLVPALRHQFVLRLRHAGHLRFPDVRHGGRPCHLRLILPSPCPISTRPLLVKETSPSIIFLK